MSFSRREVILAVAAARIAPAQRQGEVRRVTAWPVGNGGEGAPVVAKESLLESLSIQVDGRPARAVRLQGGESELLLLIVLDLVGDLAFVDPARQALISEIRNLPGNAWPAVLRAQDGLRVATDPGPDRDPAISAIENTQIAGRAGLLETVEPAARLADALLAKSPVRLAILYVTDSNIYNYREDYTNPVINPSDSRDLSRRFPEGLIREKTTKLAATLSEFDAPLFIVHLAFLRDRLNEAYQNGLQLMAEATGGTLAMCRTPNDVPGVIRAAFDRILRHWAIDLEVPAGAARNFTVQLAAGLLSFEHRVRFTRAR